MLHVRWLVIYVLALEPGFAMGQGIWNESGDAPDGPVAIGGDDGWQATVGTGALAEIRGALNRPGGDHVDTYSFVVMDRMAFYASTASRLGGSIGTQNLDTRMWLWQPDGTLLLGNDDDAFAGDFSTTLSDPSEFVSLTTGLVHSTAIGVVLNPGVYLISISAFGGLTNNPEDAANVDLADLSPGGFTSLVGRNPSAGAFDHWENGADFAAGDYVISFAGAGYSPLDCPGLDFNENGSIEVGDLDELVAAIAQGSTWVCFDLNGDNLLNLVDRDEWLQEAGNVNLGPGRSYLLGDANLDSDVDGSDFGAWNANKFSMVAAWSAGDFNADGQVDGSDFGAWNANKFQSALVVPESTVLILWGMLPIILRYRQSHRSISRSASYP